MKKSLNVIEYLGSPKATSGKELPDSKVEDVLIPLFEQVRNLLSHMNERIRRSASASDEDDGLNNILVMKVKLNSIANSLRDPPNDDYNPSNE